MIFTIFYNYENCDVILTAKNANYAENSPFLIIIIENYCISFLSFKKIFKNGTIQRGAFMQIILIFFLSFSILFVMQIALFL